MAILHKLFFDISTFTRLCDLRIVHGKNEIAERSKILARYRSEK